MSDRFSPIKIGNSELIATLIPHGATLADLRLRTIDHPLILGFEDYSLHQKYQRQYFGSIIGRYANRIGGGRCVVDGQELVLEVNAKPNHLHGGTSGFASREWDVVARSENRVVFDLQSSDGDGGYPGNVSVQAEYRIVEPSILRLAVTARTDKTTPINIVHHPYFNLDGKGDVRDHLLQINADRYLPCDTNALPTGEIAPVEKTPFNFKSIRALKGQNPDVRPNFDHTFCLGSTPHSNPCLAAKLKSLNGIEMDVWTTQNGIHLYDGQFIDVSDIGSGERLIGSYSGVCLETQNWPDSPNHSHFPNSLLKPGETYTHITEYRFNH